MKRCNDIFFWSNIHRKSPLFNYWSGNLFFFIQIYWAVEDNDCCTRCMCGALRPFDMQVFDYRGVEVIHFHRPLACQSCWFPCCLQSIMVTSPLSGEVLGSVEQNWSLCIPDYSVKNHNGETVLRITGPICMVPMCCDVEFKVRKVVTYGRENTHFNGVNGILSSICVHVIVRVCNFWLILSKISKTTWSIESVFSAFLQRITQSSVTISAF